MDFDTQMDEILNAFLIWHWQQFKTGKYEKLGHIPFSMRTQAEALAAIKQLIESKQPKDYTPEGHELDACLNHERYTSACCGCQCQKARNVAIDAWREGMGL